MPESRTGPGIDIKFPDAPSLGLMGSEKAAAGARILIAEDDAVSCELLTERLRNWGYDIVVTRNGADAMTAMRSRQAPMITW